MKTVVKIASCVIVLMLTLSLSACGAATPENTTFGAMDTVMSLTVYGGEEPLDRLQRRIEILDGLLDATDENSELSLLNTKRSVKVTSPVLNALRRSLTLCEKTDGAFDITVYPAMQAWGFTTGDYRVPDDGELQALAEQIGYTAVSIDDDGTVSLSEGAEIDLGAIAKGYAADACTDVLRDSGAKAAILNLGGTVCLYGKKPDGSRFRVGIADPDAPASYFGFLSCDEGIVATSGGYERFFEKDGATYIHILDPATAKPVESGLRSVSIVSKSGAEADALSTALFVMGLDRAVAFYQNSDLDFDFIILTDSGELFVTEGIYDDFTLEYGYDLAMNKVAK